MVLPVAEISLAGSAAKDINNAFPPAIRVGFFIVDIMMPMTNQRLNIDALKKSPAFQRMLSGHLYDASADEIVAVGDYGKGLAERYNATSRTNTAQRRAILDELFGAVGASCHIESNLYVDYGCNIYIGDNFYANFNCTMLDVCEIHIGDNCMFAPGVILTTATHPLDPTVRNSGLELGGPITIGNNVWLGANVTVNPGVTIGNDVVVGSGAVVTKDIPDNYIAVGNPARLLRKLTDDDRAYWQQQADSCP